MSISESRVESSSMIDLLAGEYADASPPEPPRNLNRCPRVIGATPPWSECTGRQEKPAQGNRHDLEVIGWSS